MNVVQEKVNKLNAILKVEIKSEDYQSKVKSTLEKYRKTATLICVSLSCPSVGTNTKIGQPYAGA